MDFSLTEEQRMLQDSLSRSLADGADWAALAELGVGAALMPEQAGGFGGTGGDIALVFRELGRAAAVTPALDSIVLGAAILAAAGGHEAQAEAAMAGTTRLAVIGAEDDDPSPIAVHGDALDGSVEVVIGGDQADFLIVAAGADNAAGWYLVDAADPGVARRGFALMDGGRGASISLTGVPGRRLGPLSLADRARAAAVLAVCADAQGAMETAFDLTLSYLKERKQFGRPLSSFQALQHRMADLRSEMEQVHSAVLNLAGALDGSDRDRHVAATKHLTGTAAMLMAEETVQLHGGMGMTEEYALAPLVRRLIAAEHRFGDSDVHLARFMAGSAA